MTANRPEGGTPDTGWWDTRLSSLGLAAWLGLFCNVPSYILVLVMLFMQLARSTLDNP